MHQALLVDELLRLIFSFAAEDGSAMVSALARSCRAWTDPALDFVWMNLTSIVPLLHTIPDVQLVDGVYVCNIFCPIPVPAANLMCARFLESRMPSVI